MFDLAVWNAQKYAFDEYINGTSTTSREHGSPGANRRWGYRDHERETESESKNRKISAAYTSLTCYQWRVLNTVQCTDEERRKWHGRVDTVHEVMLSDYQWICKVVADLRHADMLARMDAQDATDMAPACSDDDA